MGKAEEQFAQMRTVVHTTSKDDYLASMLAQPAPLGLGNRARYDHSTGTWHIWDGIRWKPDRVENIYEQVRRRLFDVWLPSKDINPTEDTLKMYSTLMNQSKKETVLKSLRSMPGIATDGEEWDQEPFLIGFENGTLDLRTLMLETSPDPAWNITRSTGFDWDPGADPSLFNDFIEEITSHNPDVAVYLLQVLGYSMLGNNQEQKFWMWVGGGSNGKGILARTVTKALGDYAYSPPAALYMRTRMGASNANVPRPELLKLQGMRFTFMSEPEGGQFNEELLKAHTGNDPIEARTLYSAKYKTFMPTHTIHFLTNQPPKTDDVGPSMQRRVRIIKFLEDYRPESGRADNTLEGRLQQPEALKGALVAIAAQAHSYLQTNTLPEPALVKSWSMAYIAENDPIAAFVSGACVESPGVSERGGALFKAFEHFCEENGYEPMTMTAFGRSMAIRYPKKRVASGTVYDGIRLKNTTDWASESSEDE